MSGENRRGSGSSFLGTMTPEMMQGSAHVSIVDETEERVELDNEVASPPAGSKLSESRSGSSSDAGSAKTGTKSKSTNKSMSDFSASRRTKSDRKNFERTATGGSGDRAANTSSTSHPPGRNVSGSNRFRITSFVKRKDDDDDMLDDNSDFDIATDSISERSKPPGKDARTRHSFWKAKSQEGVVDQSVNLMDAEIGKYERERSRTSTRRGTGRGVGLGFRQKSLVDVFLQDSDHERTSRWGRSSFADSFSDLKKNGGQGGCGCWLTALFLLVLVVVVLVTIPTFGESHVSTSPPTAAPTMVLTGIGSNQITAAHAQDANFPLTEETIPEQHPNLAQVPNSSAIEAFRFYVVDQDISEEAQLDAMGSPTKKALHWITQQDPARLPIPGYNLEVETSTTKAEYALLQRYALAVFYFSQQTTSTTASARARDVGRHLQESSPEEMANRELFDSSWLSAKPICTWCGVVCAEDAESVLEVNLPSHLLQGTIPREFLDGAAMPFLTHVDLSGNHIHGQLPQVSQERDTAGQQLGVEPLQTRLQVLKLGHNDISGKLDQLTGLTQLKEVDLTLNKITGTVPESIADLQKLEALNLSHNQLSGTVASQLGELLKLRNLHLEGNKLSGVVPEEICGLVTAHQLHIFKTDCLHGKIKCHCCTACS